MSLSTIVYCLVKDRVSYEKLVHDIRYNESSKIVKPADTIDDSVRMPYL